MKPRAQFQPGDRVLVGRGGFGRRPALATVAEWDGESAVMVIIDGKSKPVPRAVSQLRHETKPAGPSLAVEAAPKPSKKSAPKVQLRAVPKPVPAARSTAYLAYVRSHACAACQRPDPGMEAHHWAPKRAAGRKVSDYRTVPLCRRCHQHFHDTGRLPELDARTTREVFVRAQAALMDEWLSSAQRESWRRNESNGR